MSGQVTGFEQQCRALVARLGLGSDQEPVAVYPLTGGVASDIARVRVGGRDYCVKIALPRLRVAEDWQAPVHRNAAEYAWLSCIQSISPENAVALLGRDEACHGFAMEFIGGPGVHLWKKRLLDGCSPQGEAARVGTLLAKIHAASAKSDFDTGPFNNRDDFKALRLEPYLNFTARRHPDVADILNGLCDQLYRADHVLVHGDVSPKNILLRHGVPVILDAECATMGDAAFDPAFMLNHLVLKAAHMPAMRSACFTEAQALWRSYAALVDWEAPGAVEERVSRLLPALMLARVDGKSPVEYLDRNGKEIVRQMALDQLSLPTMTLAERLNDIEMKLERLGS